MKALITLIRLHNHQLDDKRRALAEAERRLANAKAQRAALDEELVAEKRHAAEGGEGVYTYGAYLQAAKRRREAIDAGIVVLEKAAAEARDAVAEAFAELKKYEITKANRERRELEEANRIEQNMLDEMGLAMHRRNSGEGN
ncbi:MAG: flagellar FliJ family protein [Oceanibaculum nanhaiense]|uniref:flagellar FliJ family protein n=1 Tax=Oceanibaculum nanhaiense TaxID=1909734 RepID=UPI0025A328E9|nr:flagellar FliJ family protein [Oceanibaculum nanhaiense]MDM7946791.1 flagellar FliJ family protein [Oceanibaculum nanhaiense]